MNQWWHQYLEQFDVPMAISLPMAATTTKYCVMIEPRVQKILPLVIKNFIYLLHAHNWGCIVFHGTENEVFLKDNLAGIDNIIYHNLGVKNLTLATYNQLMTSTSFWQTLIRDHCHHALIFQSDTALLKDTIDEYLAYD